MIALIGAIAAVVTVPAIGCITRVNLGACSAQLRDVEIVTQAESGESLANVKIQVIAQGAPEVQYTDDNGYAKVQIPSTGDVRVTLTKEGYPSQDFNLNIDSNPSTIRIIRFSETGQPDIEVLQTATGQGTTGESPIPGTNEPTSPILIQSNRGLFFQLQACKKENDLLSCERLVTDKQQQRTLRIYASSSSRFSRIIDVQGNQYAASNVVFGGASNTSYTSQTLAQDVPLRTTLTFENTQVQGNLIALVEVSAYTRDQSYFSIQFRDVPLSK